MSVPATTEPHIFDVLGTLGLNAKLFIAQLINFAIVLLILWRLVLRPLNRALRERQKTIEDSLENAKNIEANLIMAEEGYKKKIDEATQKANEIIARSKEEGEHLLSDLKVKASEEAGKILHSAKLQIEKEKEKMRQEIKEESVELILDVAGKVLGERMDSKKDFEFVKNIIK